MPGVRDTSVAIHAADEGTLLHFSHDPRSLGVTCTRGTVLRCAVSPDPLDDSSRLVEFYKDGERVGVASVQVPEDGLFGVVGMTGFDERVLLSPPVVTRRLEFDQIWEVCSPHVQHERDGLCRYVGPGHVNEESIGTIRTKQRMDPFGPLSSRSFEIRIVDSGENTYIAVGVCNRSYPHNMLPGWKETSVGYHADNGSLFDSSENGEETGQICREGDTMRCTVQPTVDGGQKQVSVVFHCNGQVVGKRVAWLPEDGLFGVFGMMSKRECVHVSLPEVHEPYAIPKLSFLSVWEVITPNLQYQENGVFAYTGRGGADMIGSVRSKLPLSPTGPNNMFEVKILDPGASCYIALGVCNPSFPPTQLPGWTENSVGFHADNGLILNGIGNEQLETRCNCVKGDVIRCTLELVDDSQKQLYVVFHRNGIFIGKSMLWNSKQGFHAQVGSMSKGEVIQIASPQTTPSYLPHNAPPRSMSVPAVQSSKEAIKRKQMSTQDFSRMTPAVREVDEPQPFSGGMHRVRTTPVLHSQPQSYQRAEPTGYPHRYTQPLTPGPHHHQYQGKPMEHLSPSGLSHRADTAQLSHSPSLHHQQHIEDPSEDQHHRQQLPGESHQSLPQGPPPTLRSVPRVHLVPFEHATTASPFPLHPVGEHPLAEQHAEASGPQSEVKNQHNVERNPFYATQVSAASAASDSDLFYQSQPSSGITASGRRQRAVSGSYEHRTPPHDSPRPFRAQTQPVTHSKPWFNTPPGGASPAVKPPFPGLETSPSFHKGSASTERVFKPGFDDSDSPPRYTVKHSPNHVRIESEHEPAKEVDVSAVPEPRLYTKKENSFCRILHNASCSDDGTTLHCTLPDDPSEPCFVMRRLQLTEKMPYFEVELVEHKPSEKVIVGIVPPDHPYTVRMGSLPCTVAYDMSTGSLVAGGELKSVAKPCAAGDVVGCKVDWSYKLEASEKDPLVEVEWFVNGCSVAKNTINAPSSGLYPAIKMISGGTVVIVRQSIGLEPDSYFTSHPLPEGFKNIEVPLITADTWRCVQRAEIDETGYVTPLDSEKASLPSIIQSQTPFTTVQPYFEVELQHPMESYSLFSVGAVEGGSDSETSIPGDTPNSVALLPLLGLVMCDGRVSTTLPLAIEEEMKTLSERRTIGVGVDFQQDVPDHSLTAAKRVPIFFTINHQLINSTYVTIPATGLYPTVAVGLHSKQTNSRLLRLHFSDPWPQAPVLPLGFARAPQKAFEVNRLNSVVAENSLPSGTDTPQILQAALPLSRSHTYFEMKILECRESHVFSCGLATHNFPLTSHPGDLRDSIGFFSNDGSVHHNGKALVVSSPFNYKGARMGCGARFPEDGSSRYMEVFFTLNGNIVARSIVENREPGLFPTIGFYTKGSGVVNVDLYAENPFPRLPFSTTWRDLENMTSEGAFLQPTSHSETCVAQLAHSVPLDRPVYFTIQMAAGPTSARISIGFTSSPTCSLLGDEPQTFPSKGKSVSPEKSVPVTVHEGWMGSLVDLSRKQALVEGSLYTVELYHLQQSDLYGCGIEPVEDRKSHLFFFTCNNQVVFAKNICLKSDMLFPSIFVKGSTGRITVDACAIWPLQTAIGRGWARVNHLFLKNSKIRHVPVKEKPSKIPVGFAQASMPITPSSSYFEVEVCSRSLEKAIAVGLAPRTYPGNTWVGWRPISIAYHLDDGCLFTGDGLKGHKIGPQIFEGQIVGCGISTKPGVATEKEKDAKVEVFFTVNGVLIVEQKISVPYGGFYPTICLESPTESVVFHRYPSFPPIRHLVGPEWASCYSVHQTGMLLEHSYKGDMPPKGVTRGFCQASQPFSPTRPYFEIKIVKSSPASMIQMGVAVRLPVGCRSPNTDSVMYYTNGQVLMRSGGNKSTQHTEKSAMGDVVGCGLEYTADEPLSVQFYLNKMKVVTMVLQEKWRKGPLFPTIVLSHPGNAVLPRLNLSPPEWDRSSLIGWLRTERVQVKGNIASYLPSGTARYMEVGLCQLSQCLEGDSSFEVEILDRGERCCIAVGAASTNYPAVNQPGWKENSVAYHGDDGNLFSNDPHGVSFGPPWKDCDVIGVGVRQPAHENPRDPETQVYFVKNGVELGHTTVTIPPSGLFPTIGFHSPREKVKITLNTGQHSLGNFNKALLKWRDVYGMRLQPTSQDNRYVLQYIENGRRMPFTGIKPAIAVYGEPFSEKLQYFEVDILSVEINSAVAIGVVPRDYSLELAPGWGKDSLGYHSDNGQLYQARDRGKYFGPIAKKGDSIGCGINFTPNNPNQCSIFFTYNGVEVGRVRTSLSPAGGFFPCICLMQQHDRVTVRLSETFKPRGLTPEYHIVGLMRISNCSYSDQIVQFSGGSSQSLTSPGFAQFSLPMHKDHSYFATHVLKMEDTVVIGLAVGDYPIKYLPGSMSISMAYDISNGVIRAVYDSNNFHRFDDSSFVCSVGDRVGCGVVSSDSKSQPGFIYFTRNRVVLKRIELADLFEDLYPVVGFSARKRSSLLFMDWKRPLFDSPNLLCDC